MRALITRPLEDADRIGALLRDRGADVFLEPLLIILPAAAPGLDLTNAQALVFTSANGVRAFADRNALRRLPVYAVGETTGAVASAYGFPDVRIAGGDVRALASLIIAEASPDAGPLVHISGTNVAGDLAGSLGGHGFTVRRERLYEARPAAAFSKELKTAFAERSMPAVFLFSPRTARTFAGLVHKADLLSAMADVTVYALSPAVADALEGLPFGAVRVAAEPTQDALLGLFDADLPVGRSPAAAVRAEHLESTKEGGPLVMTTGSKEDRPEDGDRPEDKAAEIRAGDSVVAAGAPSSGPVVEPAVAAGTSTDQAGERVEAESQPWGGSKAVVETDETDAAYGGSAGEASASEAEAEEEPPKKSHALTYFVLLLLVAAGAAGSYPWWRNEVPEVVRVYLPELPGAPVSPEVAALKGSVDDLGGRLASVESAVADLRAQVSQVSQAPGVPADIADRINSLEARISGLDGQPAPAPVSGGASVDSGAVSALQGDLQATKDSVSGFDAKVADLDKKLAEVKNDQVAPATVLALAGRLTEVEGIARQANTRRNTALALLLAVGQLREAANQGEAFDDELRSVHAIVQDGADVAPGIETLTPLATTGVSTRAALAARFDDVSRAISQAVLSPEGDTWLERTFAALTSVVTVRRVDQGAGTGAEGPLAILAEAERLVLENDLAGAVAALKGLDGAAAEAASPWLQAAEDKLTAEAALSDLTAQALARIGAVNATEPATPGTEG
ncbi:uroporphyrinogen III synthase [Rhodospirillum rubrum]|uniref:uroporphyrinogen-III synthase n=1 Tax=Rhodospirillum rubrum TaxID=1085 RepID=UPI0019084A88|nr:uroporphyrinogen-III synthase [Rhodospirillum rubrum]MBK1664226.1 uroporphyrinogen III synthase [Rhodospirillum rubrum]MBK1676452.1 uroporphyrinogen III synthase [Rhodospirillum rubrum]